jgi:hypothetical protein
LPKVVASYPILAMSRSSPPVSRVAPKRSSHAVGAGIKHQHGPCFSRGSLLLAIQSPYEVDVHRDLEAAVKRAGRRGGFARLAAMLNADTPSS